MNDMAISQYIAMVMDRQIKFKFLLDLQGVDKIILLMYIWNGWKCFELVFIWQSVDWLIDNIEEDDSTLQYISPLYSISPPKIRIPYQSPQGGS